MVKKISVVIIVMVAFMVTISASEIEQGNKVLERVNKQAKVTQHEVDKLADKTDAMTEEYRQILKEISSIDKFNQQLQVLIESQVEEIASLNQQLAGLEDTHREIYPLMQNMLSSLETFVELDMPFLLDERQSRVSVLREMLNQANTSVSEKYRRVLEAYMIEVDYGRTIEAYEQSLVINGITLNVEMLRIGRVALLYKSRDDQRIGFWNSSTNRWQDLDGSYLRHLRKGLQIARKQSAPGLITVPVVVGGEKT